MKVTKSILALLIAGLVAAGAWAAPVEEEAAMAEEMSPIDMLAKVDHSAWERGSHGGRFVVTNISGPKTFNDVVAKETSTTDITGQMYAGVVRRSQLTLEWEPGLADRWEISEDQKTITLHLARAVWVGRRPDHGGRDLWSSRDLQERGVRPARGGLNVWRELAEFELIDDLDLPHRGAVGGTPASSRSPRSGRCPPHLRGADRAEGAAAVQLVLGGRHRRSTIVGTPVLIASTSDSGW